jgi:hypothetical protein
MYLVISVKSEMHPRLLSHHLASLIEVTKLIISQIHDFVEIPVICSYTLLIIHLIIIIITVTAIGSSPGGSGTR